MSHTPGPWFINDKSVDCQKDKISIETKVMGDDYFIAQVDSSISQEANARLIAAAPELLEACKAFIEYDEGSYEDGVGMMIRYEHARRMINVAISKATGENNG